MRWRAKCGNQKVEEYEDDSDYELFRCFKLPQVTMPPGVMIKH